MENSHPLLETLNDQQRIAVTVPDGPALILAGPGSGKTRVLTHRIAWMLTEMRIPPWQTMAVTFTNKAAREMRGRLDEMLGGGTARSMVIGTFHAACVRILRREADAAGLSPNYVIFDSDDQLSVMKQVVADLGLDDKRYRPRSLLNAVSSAKNELIPPTDYPVQTYFDEIVVRAYARYQDMLRQNAGLDFDDLLMETVKLFRANPLILQKYQDRYRYVLVDEFQDTNMAQYVILHLMTREHRNLYVVADEDQSIYSWRGADYRNIRRLREDYPKLREILLEENYRSTQIILDAARAVIAQNPDRTSKHLFTQKTGGELILLRESYDEEAEADFVAQEVRRLRREGYPYAAMAVMYRTNAQSRALEETFVKHNVPYRLIGGTRFYSRREIKDVLAFMRLAQNPDDDISLLRVINVPRRGIGARTLAAVTAEARGTSRFQGLLALLESDRIGGRAKNALQGFATMIQGWIAMREEATVAQLIDRILMDTGYESDLRDGSDEGESRWENVMALRAVVADVPEITLTDFLTEVALVADVDELAEEVDAVTLLTLHSAKGLEFPIVFLTGLEEGLLPHSRSVDTPQELAEERRLFYVGITRAEKHLYITYAFRRGWYGRNEPSAPSRFLDDLPDDVLQRPRKAQQQATRPKWGASSWGSSSSSSSSTSFSVSSPPPRPDPTYRRGQRIRHVHYGEGVILESEIEGREEVITVHFDNGLGVKKLVAELAPIEAISEH